ncbi:MAG TPA: hypothetical protein VHL09_01465 [Dehalococcoidia bacterium]|nr:hypothetical protein [Dehalococcoidia bacterium]
MDRYGLSGASGLDPDETAPIGPRNETIAQTERERGRGRRLRFSKTAAALSGCSGLILVCLICICTIVTVVGTEIPNEQTDGGPVHRIAIVSSARLDPEFYGKPPDPQVLETRLRKLLTK